MGHPLDTIKVRLQGTRSLELYNGRMTSCFVRTVRQEGPTALYKGAVAPLAGAMLQNAAIFGLWGLTTSYFCPEKDSLWGTYKAACVTGCLLVFIESPIELVKCRLQNQIGATGYSGSFDAARTIVQQRGLRGLFQGLFPTILRSSSAKGAYFTSFDACSQALTVPGELPTISACAVAGGVAGGMAWGFNYPTDVVKSRMQVDSSDPSLRKYRNSFHCLTEIVQKEGVSVLFRGWVPCMVRAVPVNASIFAAYSYSKRSLDAHYDS